MTNDEVMELVVPIPSYASRFLSTIARETGLDENEVALFFLCQKAYYAQPRRDAKKAEPKTILPCNVCAAQPEN